eukprot:2856536-Prymnesium_polylepis.1
MRDLLPRNAAAGAPGSSAHEGSSTSQRTGRQPLAARRSQGASTRAWPCRFLGWPRGRFSAARTPSGRWPMLSPEA